MPITGEARQVQTTLRLSCRQSPDFSCSHFERPSRGGDDRTPTQARESLHRITLAMQLSREPVVRPPHHSNPLRPTASPRTETHAERPERVREPTPPIRRWPPPLGPAPWSAE